MFLLQSNKGDNKRIILVVALPISSFFIIICIGIGIVCIRRRAKGAEPVYYPQGLSELQLDGEDQGHVDGQGLSELEDGEEGRVENQGCVQSQEHSEVQGHGKDQTDFVFEYEGQLMGVRISTNEQTI